MKKLIAALSMLLIVSCSNPTNNKYNEEKLTEDLTKIKESKKWTEDDARLFAGWLLKSKLQGQDLSNKTYQQILDEAKSFKAEQDALAEKAKKEEAARAEKMKNAAVVSIYDHKYEDSDYNNFKYDETNVFKYAIQNKTNKEIKAMKFHFNIYNALGDEIGKGYEMSVLDNRVPANGTYQGEMSFEASKFDDSDVRLKNSNFKDLTFQIIIDKIVYTDGSVLE